ncbi:hypothetical protein BTO19_25165 [Vibrio parahaemolyticus]|uniref:Uncharacterized protein n=2 Tax=Vibrio TaxID=662 RepID=A0AAV2VKV9_9VIBR|nr:MULTISPECIES: hypothetical protein [Vibrio]OUJ22000.1 hypothetical protein BTO19_25165 [Vibrio parahaemolyticus]TBT60383.1 hypothetical protein D5E77_25170 [Vibrio parahaemolyticus]TOE18513.1 hypothetical protein CGJ47_24020 [Vibrio parahaemolyticus]CCO45114.1 conserved hypothetical protein [Vibrio nigripulchritudo SOn1]HCG7362901.1 hypothetical protein [Vibrio parahaemolyticus]
MAKRPVFAPYRDKVGVEEKLIDFKWYSGFAVSQKQKSIQSLHKEAQVFGYHDLLEISSKSEDELGVSMSAFNLTITTKKHNRSFSVESAFQGSKVFERGGPYTDLFMVDSLTAKRDIRIKESGNLISFKFFNQSFPNEPRTFFYDWLYINALVQNTDICNSIRDYDGFTDIEFNPEKSINCQAHAVALYRSLVHNGVLQQALSSPSEFLALTSEHYERQKRNVTIQKHMF